MMKHRAAALICCCAAVLTMSGCSRQQSDWQKTRETNTTDSYEQFLKKYPSGEFTAQAQARVKELYEERDWQKARDADTPEAYQAFLKQYPEGKWTEEARIRVENFTLAQAPSSTVALPAAGGTPGTASAPAPGRSPANAAPSAATESGGEGANEDESAASSVKPAPKMAAKSTPATTSGMASKIAKPAASAAGTAAALAAPVAARHGGSKSATASGAFAVQLGAFKSGASAAHERWAHLEKKYPTLLKGLSSTVVAKKTSARTLYRLRASGGLTETRARAICRSLKAKSQVCVVVPPPHG